MKSFRDVFINTYVNIEHQAFKGGNGLYRKHVVITLGVVIGQRRLCTVSPLTNQNDTAPLSLNLVTSLARHANFSAEYAMVSPGESPDSTRIFEKTNEVISGGGYFPGNLGGPGCRMDCMSDPEPAS